MKVCGLKTKHYLLPVCVSLQETLRYALTHFSKWVILSLFPRREEIDSQKRKLPVCRADRITACSQVLFDRSHHHSYCWDESQILWGPLRQKSFRQLRKLQVAEADSLAAKLCCRQGFNGFNLASSGLLSGFIPNSGPCYINSSCLCGTFGKKAGMFWTSCRLD